MEIFLVGDGVLLDEWIPPLFCLAKGIKYFDGSLFASPLDRPNAIAGDAELQEKPLSDVRRMNSQTTI